jgi:hypothetical protein
MQKILHVKGPQKRPPMRRPSLQSDDCQLSVALLSALTRILSLLTGLLVRVLALLAALLTALLVLLTALIVLLVALVVLVRHDVSFSWSCA